MNPVKSPKVPAGVKHQVRRKAEKWDCDSVFSGDGCEVEEWALKLVMRKEIVVEKPLKVEVILKVRVGHGE